MAGVFCEEYCGTRSLSCLHVLLGTAPLFLSPGVNQGLAVSDRSNVREWPGLTSWV